MALHLTVLSFLMAFHKDRVWGHCCLPFIPANCLKSSNTIYLKHMPMLMTLSFTCRLVLTRLLIRLMRSLPWNAVYLTFVRGCLRISSNLLRIQVERLMTSVIAFVVTVDSFCFEANCHTLLGGG